MMTFAEAIEDSQKFSKRHVMLGNGFSIAARPDIFQYGALFDRADFSNLSPSAKNVFDVLNTRDFESVIKALKTSSDIVEHYSPKQKGFAETLRNDAASLREVLVTAIADSHPERPSDISDIEFDKCRSFLAHFDKVYSFNYDLLLYWTLMRDLDLGDGEWDDGFRKASEDPDAEFVEWEIQKSDRQNVYYLHGALHIFDTGSQLQKYTWIHTGVPLIQQIRKALEQEKYPLIVAEGSSDKKMDAINHSNYLSRCYRSFAHIGGSVFMFGFSLAENDYHILRLFEKNTVQKLYVGIYGDPDRPENKRILATAMTLPELRKQQRTKLEVEAYQAESASVWA